MPRRLTTCRAAVSLPRAATLFESPRCVRAGARFFLCAALSVLWACGGPRPDACGPSNCAGGCCDSSGVCQLPSSTNCGQGGNVCTTCFGTQSCNLGICVVTQGGTDGGSDAGLDAGPTETRDAGVDGGMTSDGGTTSDGGMASDGGMVSDGGTSATDGGCVRIMPALVVCPLPPAGATLCGSGDFDNATARAACNALDTSALSSRPMKDCNAFDGLSGHYEAWCGTTDVYLWVAVETMTSDAVMACPYTVMLPDGGMYSQTPYELRWALDGNYTRRSALVTPELADGGRSRVELLELPPSNRSLQPQPFTNDPTRWTGSFALESSFRLTDRVRTTGEFVFPSGPVDCHRVSSSATRTVLLTVPFVADP